MSLCFELIGKIEYSFQDYEHLLRKKIQLIGDGSGTSHSEILLHKACANEDGDIPDEIEDMLERIGQEQHKGDDVMENENQQVEITIRNF